MELYQIYDPLTALPFNHMDGKVTSFFAIHFYMSCGVCRGPGNFLNNFKKYFYNFDFDGMIKEIVCILSGMECEV